jgi:hypothetical protein
MLADGEKFSNGAISSFFKRKSMQYVRSIRQFDIVGIVEIDIFILLLADDNDYPTVNGQRFGDALIFAMNCKILFLHVTSCHSRR